MEHAVKAASHRKGGCTKGNWDDIVLQTLAAHLSETTVKKETMFHCQLTTRDDDGLREHEDQSRPLRSSAGAGWE